MNEQGLHTRTEASPTLLGSGFRQKAKDYGLLVKLRLTLTVVFSSWMAYLIGLEGAIDWPIAGALVFGGFLVTGAANALNQVLERDFDSQMKRTADRPVAAGRMPVSEAVLAAGFMALAGITLLAFINPWTAFFGTLAMVMYAFLYTPLKRMTPGAVMIGAIPGALPTLIGCVAGQGQVTYLALVLFGIQFLWQFPHFWSIGFLGYEDYRKAGYQFIPSEGDDLPSRSIGIQALLHAVFLLPLVFVPFYLGEAGWLSAAVGALLTLGYVGLSWNFYRQFDRKASLKLMFYSFFYLPLTLLILFIDKL